MQQWVVNSPDAQTNTSKINQIALTKRALSWQPWAVNSSNKQIKTSKINDMHLIDFTGYFIRHSAPV